MTKGLIQIYSGDGKGKTTAAIGQAVRALGHGLKVGVVFFHKKVKPDEGEFKSLKKLGADVFQAVPVHPCFDKNVSVDEIRKGCLDGVALINKLFKENKYDLLVLDEINVSLKDGFLKNEELENLLKNKPVNLEIILTGRGISQDIAKLADLISIVKSEKHPYNIGLGARKGVEY